MGGWKRESKKGMDNRKKEKGNGREKEKGEGKLHMGVHTPRLLPFRSLLQNNKNIVFLNDVPFFPSPEQSKLYSSCTHKEYEICDLTYDQTIGHGYLTFVTVTLYQFFMSDHGTMVITHLFVKLTVHTQWSHRHYIIALSKRYKAQ